MVGAIAKRRRGRPRKAKGFAAKKLVVSVSNKMRNPSGNFVQRIGWGKLPFPPKLVTKLHYYNSYRSTTSAASVNSLTIGINNPYSSTSSGWSINGQPFGYDQLLSATGPYAQYVVTGAKVKLTYLNNSSTSPAAALIQWSPDNSYTSITTPQYMMQYGGQANSIYIPYIGVSGNSHAKKIVKKYFDIAKMCGLSRAELLGDPNYAGAYNGAPTNVPTVKMVLGAQASTASTDSDCTVLLDICFYVQLQQLQVDLPAS